MFGPTTSTAIKPGELEELLSGLLKQQQEFLLQHWERVLASQLQALADQLRQLPPQGAELAPALSCRFRHDSSISEGNTVDFEASGYSFQEVIERGSVPSFGPANSFNASQVAKRNTAALHSPMVHKLDYSSSRSNRERAWACFAGCITSPYFECLCSFLILSNAVFFGIEAEYMASSENKENAWFFRLCSRAYTVIFMLELALRIAVDPKGFCFSQQWLWNLLDSLLVLASVAELITSRVEPEATMTNFSYVRIIRLARTVRVFRFVRLLKAFTSLRILINSVLNTMRSLGWTMLLLLSILYVFGLLFTQATNEYLERPGREESVAAHLRTNFGSIFLSTYTLFKAITNGLAWGDIAWPLGAVHPMWEGIFSLFIMFTYLAVLNVVTGVFCQSAIESANYDKDTIVQAQLSMTQKYTEQLQRLFSQIDGKNTGVVTLTMFEECLKDDSMKAYFDGLEITTDDAWNLFKLLDANESNAIDIEEFVQGCMKLQGTARSIDTHMLLYESRWTMKRMHEVLEAIQRVNETCAGVLLTRAETPLLPQFSTQYSGISHGEDVNFQSRHSVSSRSQMVSALSSLKREGKPQVKTKSERSKEARPTATPAASSPAPPGLPHKAYL